MVDNVTQPVTEHVTEKGSVVPKNKGGRPPKPESISVQVKEDLFKAFRRAGGLDRLVKLLEEPKALRKEFKTAKAREKHEKRVYLANKVFLEFIKLLSSMVPKQTSIDVETKSVIFQFTNKDPEEIRKAIEDDVVDIQFSKEV